MIPKSVSLTLVEPKYPVNLGHVARLAKNFGVGKLYLVRPRVDISAAAVYASHASDILDRAVVTTFDEVRKDNELLIATTAVRASKRSNVIRRSVNPEGLGDLLASSGTSSLVFGRDTTGLTNAEIRKCDVTTTIDVGSSYKALNVGHSVAILLYLVSRGTKGRRARVQSRKAREVFAQSFFQLAADGRLPPHKVKTLYEAAKRLAAGSGLTDRQLNLMPGVFRKASQTIGEAQSLDSKA